MKSYALWDQNETAEITSVHMVDELLDQLTLRAKKDRMPFTVQIILNDDSALLITVGSDLSHLEFYSTSQHPPVVPSNNQWNENIDEILIFYHGGEPSSVNKKSCIPIVAARQAVRQYYATGKRPTNIN